MKIFLFTILCLYSILGDILCSCSSLTGKYPSARLLAGFYLQDTSEISILQLIPLSQKIHAFISRYLHLPRTNEIGNFILFRFGDQVKPQLQSGLYVYSKPAPPSQGWDIATPPQNQASIELYDVNDTILSPSGYILTGIAFYDSTQNVILKLTSHRTSDLHAVKVYRKVE